MSISQPDRSTDSERPIPAMIGPYFIERQLGAGGMGTVYLGRHRETDQFVAVKLLPASMAREPGFVARFTREIEALRQLKNEHTVELYESGEDHDSFYYAMEYVEGETLADRLERERRIPWQETIEIAVQVCAALKSAHNAGIIHRDLKPSNLLIRNDGVVKLADFGVAQVFATGKLTVTGGVLGTAEYMSPEQAQGKRATKQSDLYSLGAVIYVMLTGRPPFTGKTPLDVLQKHRFSQFDSVRRLVPDIPYWLDEIVCQCLSKKPEDRFPDAYVLSLRLQEVPRKVELRLSESLEIGSTDETQAATSASAVREAEVGGTLVRDLFRAQVEAERRSRGISQLLDNVWVLIGLLIGLAVLVYVLSIVSTPSEQQLYERGVELMKRTPGPAWDTANRDYFQKLLSQNKDAWQEKVSPYLQQIAVYELRKSVLGRTLKQDDLPQSEPEAVIRQAMKAREEGRFLEARQMLIALKEILNGNAKWDNYRLLAEQFIEETAADDRASQLTYLQDALDRADALFEKGDVEKAVSIWFSIKKLYDDRPDAGEYVRQASARYLEATGVQLIDANDVMTPSPSVPSKSDTEE